MAVMKPLDPAVELLSEVSDMIRRPHTRTRLKESCFGTPIGRTFHSRLDNFTGKVKKDRWGRVAWCVEQILSLDLAVGLEQESFLAQPRRQQKL